MTTNKSCPVCGSEAIETTTERRSTAAPLGPSVAYEAAVDRCTNCGETGDFDAVNDVRIEQALHESEVASIRQILEQFAHQGISNAQLERALRLPQRTTSRWKDGKVSAGPAALLRFVHVYPWLVEVADSGFSPEVAAFVLIREAGRLIAGAVATQAVTASESLKTVTVGIALKLQVQTQAAHSLEASALPPQRIRTTSNAPVVRSTLVEARLS